MTANISGQANTAPPGVQDQYESLPYPPREPADENQRLIKTWLDDLPMVNHYCFAGRETFKNRFRVLIAGGGTGDATIFLAERLKHTDAEIVQLDFSGASNQIARDRAEVRGLRNISWIHDSLLNLPALGLERFDYINCAGVLHHLPDPDAGLRALLAVLKDTGALGLMLYGQIGRTGVYQMQTLMRLINGGETDTQRKIDNAVEILKALPSSNWFKRTEDLHHDHKIGDAGIYDLLLHSQDRAYTVGEIFDWIHREHGLHIKFSDIQRGRAPYLPHVILGHEQPKILDRIKKLPIEQQYAIAELLGGTIIPHSFFATRSPTCTAPYGNTDYVPFFFRESITGPQMAQIFNSGNGKPFVLNHAPSGMTMRVNPGRYAQNILHHIDGMSTFQQIFDKVRIEVTPHAAPPSNAALFADFRESFDILNALDRLLLRHYTAELPY